LISLLIQFSVENYFLIIRIRNVSRCRCFSLLADKQSAQS